MNNADWEQQRAFLAVLRTGSLSGAARQLGIAQPTVRARIEALENALSVALFTRSPGGLAPTDMALSLARPAEAMAYASDDFIRTASAAVGDPAGVVRLSASEVIAVEVLPPILARLRETAPGISITLAATNRNEDLLRREADIAIRMVRPTQAGLVARGLGAVVLGIHAHRAYLDSHGWPADLAACEDHALIGVETDNPIVRQLAALGLPVDRFAFRTDSDLASLAAIRAGLGIGICQVALAAREPDIVRLFPDSFALGLDSWVVMHEDLRGVARMRLVFDALAVGLIAYVAEGGAVR